MAHRGFALIDIISPCVTFNNHAGSTKSYDYTREHVETAAVVDFVPMEQEITIDQVKGSTQRVTLHNGDSVELSKLADNYDPTDRRAAIDCLQDHKEQQKLLTGLIYLHTESDDFHNILNLPRTPLSKLEQQDLCPGSVPLAAVNQSLK